MQLKQCFWMEKFLSLKRKMMLLLFLGVSFGAFAQSVLTGKVIDQTGEPIIGASVKVKESSAGTITDVSGQFKLNLTGKETLVVSYIGYLKQEIPVNGKTSISIKLVEDQKALDEVVVVGYGTQKKTTLTGAVTQISGDAALKGKATTSVAAALQGEIPGLTVTRTSSRPGNEGLSIQLRGGISVNTVSPMIVIDGIDSYQWELSQLNPSDIENVSVLKDAAASIYGTRAAGGVILITTKRGKEGKLKVSYSGSGHMNYEGKRFPVATGQQWAQMNILTNSNDAVASGSQNNYWLFTEDMYKNMANGVAQMAILSNGLKIQLDPLNPTANQFDDVYGTTYGQSHNISISGGNEKLRTMTSLGYADDRSLVKVVLDGTKKYNFRTNLDYTVNNWIKTEGNFSFDRRLVSTPTNGIGLGLQDMFIFPMYNPQGQFYDGFGSNNILAKLTQGGRTNSTESILRLGGKVTLDMGFVKALKGLTFTANANIKDRKGWKVERGTTVTMYDWAGEYKLANNIYFQTKPTDTYVTDTYGNDLYQSYGVFGNYDRKIEKHHFALMGGVTSETSQNTSLWAKRINMSNDLLDALNTGDASNNPTNGGGANAWGLISYLGRFNYDFDETYLLEVTYRSDGSSKLASQYRWANFGSALAAIRLNQFSFIKNLNVFDNLKLRASYGETGSLSGIGQYDYISGISTGTTVFGTTPSQFATSWVSSMTSSTRTWERVANTNFGVDFTILNNRLTGQFDYFNRLNKGMLIQVGYPSTLGATAPYTNDGNFTAKGFEAMLQWKDKIGKDFQYSVGVSLADARTNVTDYPGKTAINAGSNSIIQGKPLNAIYVYKTNGYLQNETDVTNYYSTINATGTLAPTNGTTNRLTPGCVRKVDLNNDGKITTADLSYYGDANAHYTFGINLGASYKGFDFSCFIQGVAKQNIVRTGVMSYPFSAGWMNQNAVFLNNTWTTDNTNARWPLMSRNGSRNAWNYSQTNDINVINASYARCKSMVLGYTLPKKIVNKIGLTNLRAWVSGDNLFEFANIADGFDPETQSGINQGNVDVYARTLSVGVDVSF
jgi:TonB-linked SusC/RagA family outer membrane protein